MIRKFDDSFIVSSPESGHCLDTWFHDGEWRVHLWPYHGKPNQRWRFARLEDFTYRITSVETGKCLDAWQEADRTIVHPYDWHAGDNQRWWIDPLLA